MIETLWRYPRRQWPVCPNCGSRETLKTEGVKADRFQCEACHHQWSAVQPQRDRFTAPEY